MILKKFVSKLPVTIALCSVGTLLSGTIFLSAAIFVIGANIPFSLLVVTVVLPAVVMNGVAFALIYPIVITLVKRSKFETAVSQAA